MATTLPRNDELADQLKLLADLSELEGEDSFRVLAYRRAATRPTARPRRSRSTTFTLEGGRQKSLSQEISKTIKEKIAKVVETGEMAALDEAGRLWLQEEVMKFVRLPGLGPKKTARRIWKELGVFTTLAELKAAAEQQRLRGAHRALVPRARRRYPDGARGGASGPRESRRLLGDGLPGLSWSFVEELRRGILPAVGVRGRARRAAPQRPSATST